MHNAFTSIIGQCITSDHFNFLEADHSFIDLLQRDLAEIRTLDVLAVTHPEDRTTNSRHLDILRERGEPFAIVKRYVRSDNSIQWVRNHVSLIRDGIAGTRLLATVETIAAPLEGERALVEVANRILKRREVRCTQFVDDIFSEAASDILVDLFVSEQAKRETCVSNACVASHAPSTTALRHIMRLEEKGLVARIGDARDKRRYLLELTECGRNKVTEMLRTIERSETH